jgi:hypothetical protein
LYTLNGRIVSNHLILQSEVIKNKTLDLLNSTCNEAWSNEADLTTRPGSE